MKISFSLNYLEVVEGYVFERDIEHMKSQRYILVFPKLPWGPRKLDDYAELSQFRNCLVLVYI